MRPHRRWMSMLTASWTWRIEGDNPGVPAQCGSECEHGRRTSLLGGFYFNGIIDDLRIYNRALSQTEIQDDMNTPVGTPAPTNLHLLQHLRLRLHLHLPQHLHRPVRGSQLHRP